MRMLLLFIAAIGAASAVPVAETNEKYIQDLLNTEALTRNAVIEGIILDALESLREDMITGTDTQPVLDPLYIEQVEINGANFGYAGSHLNLYDIVVSHLSTFVVNQLTVTTNSVILQRYTIAFDFIIPEVDVESEEYDLLLSAMGLEVFGNEDASLKLIEPRLSGTIVARIGISIIGGIGLNVNVESANVKLGLKAFEPDFRGLFGHQGASDFANSFLEHLVPEVIRLYEKQISAYLNRVIPRLANGILGRAKRR